MAMETLSCVDKITMHRLHNGREMGVWEHPAQHQQQPPATWNVNDAMVLPMMGTRRSRRSIVRCNEVVTTEENPWLSSVHGLVAGVKQRGSQQLVMR